MNLTFRKYGFRFQDRDSISMTFDSDQSQSTFLLHKLLSLIVLYRYLIVM